MKSETRKDYFNEISDIKVALLASRSYAELEKLLQPVQKNITRLPVWQGN